MPGVGRARGLERHQSSHGGKATGHRLAHRRRRRTAPPRRPATARSTRSSARSTGRSSRSSAGTRCSSDYEIRAVSAGEDAQGQVLVRCRRSTDDGPGALVVTGHGLRPTSSRPRSRPTSWRSTSSTAPRSAASARRSWPARAAEELPVTGGAADRDRRYRSSRSPATASGRRSSAPPGRVLDAAGARPSGSTSTGGASLVGGAAIDAYGVAIRDEDVERCAAADAVLLGAVGGPRWDDPNARVRPEQALFALRGGLGLFANLRPVTVQPALVAVLAAAARAARGRRPADRARADRRPLLRPARRKSATDGRTAAAPCDTLPYTSRRSGASSAWRSSSPGAAQQGHQRRQGQRPGHRAGCGARSSRRSSRTSRTSSWSTGSSTRARCCSSPGRRRST